MLYPKVPKMKRICDKSFPKPVETSDPVSKRHLLWFQFISTTVVGHLADACLILDPMSVCESELLPSTVRLNAVGVFRLGCFHLTVCCYRVVSHVHFRNDQMDIQMICVLCLHNCSRLVLFGQGTIVLYLCRLYLYLFRYPSDIENMSVIFHNYVDCMSHFLYLMLILSNDRSVPVVFPKDFVVASLKTAVRYFLMMFCVHVCQWMVGCLLSTSA